MIDVVLDTINSMMTVTPYYTAQANPIYINNNVFRT